MRPCGFQRPRAAPMKYGVSERTLLQMLRAGFRTYRPWPTPGKSDLPRKLTPLQRVCSLPCTKLLPAYH